MDNINLFADRCRTLAERFDLAVQSLPDAGNGDELKKVDLGNALQFLESAATELKDTVSRVKRIEAVLSEKQADIIERDDVETSATAKLAEAEAQSALAGDKMREYEILKGKLEVDQSRVKADLAQAARQSAIADERMRQYEKLKGKLEDDQSQVQAKLAEAETHSALTSEKLRMYETLKRKLEDDRSQVMANMEFWASKLEALKQQELAIANERVSANAVTMAEKNLRSLNKEADEIGIRKAAVQAEVDELNKRKTTLQKEVDGIHDNLLEFRRRWQRLHKQDKDLDNKIKEFNERISALDELQQSHDRMLSEEKERVGRRDETISRLQATVQAKRNELRAQEDTVTSLRAESEAALQARNEKDQAIRGLKSKIETEKKSAEALRTQLSEANNKVKALEQASDEVKLQVEAEKKSAEALRIQLSDAKAMVKALEQASDETKNQQDSLEGKYEDLLRRIEELKVSSTEAVDGLMTSTRDTVKSSVDGIEQLKEAMVVATGALKSETEVVGQFRGVWSPKVRQVESSAKQLDDTNKDFRLLEQGWSARLREVTSLAEGKKAELIHAFSEQTNAEHKAELAGLHRRHEDEREADRAALSEARSEVEELRKQLSQAVEIRTSPERRHKRVRGDDYPHTPPFSEHRPQGEPSRWKAAVDTADAVWRSFEPVILTDDMSYSELIGHLSFAVETEKNAGRFREFLKSDAQGWYCAEAVIELGYKDGKSRMEKGCAYSEKHRKKGCTGLRKVAGSRKLEVKEFEGAG